MQIDHGMVVDILGYWFSPLGLGIARKTVERCAENVSRLYEQGADLVRIGTYLGRWVSWVRGGVEWAVDGSSPVKCLIARPDPKSTPKSVN